MSTTAISAWRKGERIPGSYSALNSFLTAIEKAAGLPRGKLDDERKTLKRLLEMARKEKPAEPQPGVTTLRVRDSDPLELMVHRARTTAGGNAVPAYIERDVDGAVRRALARTGQDGGVLLLVGDSTAGKTRCAYEAMHAVLPDHLLFVPASADELAEALDALTLAASQGENCLLWLDDAERFLTGPTGLGLPALRQLRTARAAVLGTIRSRIRRELPACELTRLAEEFQVSRLWSPGEIERTLKQWRATRDQRLRLALQQAEDFGIAESLAAGPELWRMLRGASVIGGNPRGAALVKVAIDLALAGWETPIAPEVLEELHEHYLPGTNKRLIGPEPLADALAWATEPRLGVTRLLIPDGTGFRAFDYLVDAHLRDRQPSPELLPKRIWDTALRHGNDHQRFSIAVAAHANDRVDIAVRSLGPLAEAGSMHAIHALGVICQRRSREEAAKWLQLAVDAGDSLAMRLMGNLQRRMRDYQAADDWYRRAADAGDEVCQAYCDEPSEEFAPAPQEPAVPTGPAPEPVRATGPASEDEEWYDEDKPWEPAPRTMRVLQAAFSLIADEAYDSVEEAGDTRVNLRDNYVPIFSELPVVTWGQNRQWRRQLARCFDDLAGDIEKGTWPQPTCTGEEMAMHLAVEHAGQLASYDPELVLTLTEGLPETLEDYDFDMCLDLFLEDTDVLFLYEPWSQGIEDPDNTINQFLGIAALEADRWFEPFRKTRQRDPERGFRR
ncbi:tetratricopeptide repeat protein [Streptomyces yaizuensis]|uniref:Sel1 repeat family protein n=1 Tax=Streptomyces yaizuensis TaxID=2989713 RepID=A0ABQ5P7Q3_9ACTN|nr:hypothetical protein [Streptomyces sp. YSPA8]GLF98626.1 sel1 repeat family protein [Streptomyces sp. YSPA8]